MNQGQGCGQAWGSSGAGAWPGAWQPGAQQYDAGKGGGAGAWPGAWQPPAEHYDAGKGGGKGKGSWQKGGGKFQGKKDEDTDVMESLRREEQDDVKAFEAAAAMDRQDSDSGDALPPPASEAEVEEARQIVEKAQREAVYREKMKEKAKTATAEDLQAMIN